MRQKKPAPNSTYKKLAVQWLNETLCPLQRIQCWQTVLCVEIDNFL